MLPLEILAGIAIVVCACEPGSGTSTTDTAVTTGSSTGTETAGTGTIGTGTTDTSVGSTTVFIPDPCDLFAEAGVPKGIGNCAEPWIFDLSQKPVGTLVAFTVTAGVQEGGVAGTAECIALLENTERDIVFQILLPADATALHVSNDNVTSTDPILAVHAGSTCDAEVVACADDKGPGECEILSVPVELVGLSPIVRISETVYSGRPLKVRFGSE